MKSTQCCPKFDTEKWDKKTFNWENKKFVMESMPEIFHIPFPGVVDKKITKMWTSIEKNKKYSQLKKS